jgi:hypothetical protein
MSKLLEAQEFAAGATVAKFAIVQMEGQREVFVRSNF